MYVVGACYNRQKLQKLSLTFRTSRPQAPYQANLYIVGYVFIYVYFDGRKYQLKTILPNFISLWTILAENDFHCREYQQKMNFTVENISRKTFSL